MLTEACNSDKCHCPRCESARAEGQYLRARIAVVPASWPRMRKPKASTFFAIEVGLWIAGFLTLIWSFDFQLNPSILFMKISFLNMGIVAFNMIGGMISAATGWTPWRD